MISETPEATRSESRISGFTQQYWTFLFAENLYDIGLYIFVLLYNLYLLDLGYREDFLGWVTSAMSIGGISGTLPAAGIIRKVGLKRTTICASASVAILCMLRVATLGGPWLIGTAFVSGFISSIWAVTVVPMVADLTNDRNRAMGYSIWSGWGIGLGILVGVVGGSMTGWIEKSGIALAHLSARQMALLLGSGTALLSPLLLLRLPVGLAGNSGAKVFPLNSFVRRYLFVLAVWNLGVGAFNPFFAAYFSRQLHMSVPNIGIVFSVTHIAELGGLLAAPFVMRRFGVVRGISMMQAAVALALALLATGPPGVIASVTYALFGAFQFMSEPAIFTLLMSGVKPEERAGASSLNFFVTSASQAGSSAIAGVSIVRFGYGPLLIFAAVTTALAAWLFHRLMGMPDDNSA